MRLVASIAIFGSACASYSGIVRDRFASEYRCGGQVDVEDLGGNAFRASGCGSEATYVCASGIDQTGVVATREFVCVQDSPSAAPAAAPSGPTYDWPPGSGRVRQRRDDFQGVTVITMEMTVSSHALRLVGAPAAARAVALFEIVAPGGGSRYRTCNQLEILADRTPHRFEAKAHETGGAGEETTRFDVRLETLRTIVATREIKARFCRTDWQFTPSQVATLADFVHQYDEVASTEAPPTGDAGPNPDAGP